MLVGAGTAAAQDYPGGTTTQRQPTDPGDPADVGGVLVNRADPGGTKVAGVQTTRGQALPATGTDVVALAAIGSGLTVTGLVLVRRSRRPAVATA